MKVTDTPRLFNVELNEEEALMLSTLFYRIESDEDNPASKLVDNLFYALEASGIDHDNADADELRFIDK